MPDSQCRKIGILQATREIIEARYLILNEESKCVRKPTILLCIAKEQCLAERLSDIIFGSA